MTIGAPRGPRIGFGPASGFMITARRLALGLLGGGSTVAPDAITNETLPTFSGALNDGQTLTATPGTWTVTVGTMINQWTYSFTPAAYLYQWLRDGAEIAGATAQTYVYVAATDDLHAISVRVTGVAGNGATAVAVSVAQASGAVLDDLTLSASTIAENSVVGTVVGTLLGKTIGSALSLTGSAGGRFAINGSNQIIAGLVATDYETATSHSITVRETLAGAANTPHDTTLTITVTNVAEGVYDYTITSDADWGTIPAPLLSGGGLIGVAPGTYSAKTITATPSAPLIFRATTRATTWNATKLEWDAVALGSRARVESIVLFGTSNIYLDGLEIVTSSWQVNTVPALWLRGTNIGYSVSRCYIHSGYRGAVDTPHDPSATYPEFASIIPQFTSGVLTGFIESGGAYRPYVGDLMADGTYPMVFNSISGVGTFSVAPVANFTVAGGYITTRTIVSGGTSTIADATNNSTGALSKVVTWVGQKPMASWLAYGIKDYDGNSINNGSMTITDCLFEDLCNGVKGGVPKLGGSLDIIGNTFRRMYQDLISVGISGSTVPPNLTIAWNVGTQPFSVGGDAGDPHSDFAQCYMNDLTSPYTPSNWNVEIYANVFYNGIARGGVQGIFLADPPAGIAYSGRVTGNIVASARLANGLVMERVSEAYVFRNTIVRFDPTNTTDNTNPAAIRFDDALPWTMLGNNIFEGTIYAGGASLYVDQVFLPNTTLGLNGASIAYSSVFTQGAVPTTAAQAIAYFTPKGAYSSHGIGTDGYLDFANRIIDRTKEPVYAKMPIKIGQTPSSNISSAYAKILGGPDTGTVSLSGGTATLSNSSAGAGEGAAAASLSYTRGQYLKAILPSSSSGSSASTLNATFNGLGVNRFDVITALVSAFPIADNQGAAYSKIDAPPVTSGHAKLLLGIRCRQDVLAANANIMAQAAGSSFRLYTTSGASMRLQLVSSTVNAARFPFTNDTAMHTYLFATDFTKTDAAAGQLAVIDSVVQTLQSGSVFDSTGGTRTFSTTNVFGSAGTGIGLFGEADGGGVLYNGAVEWLWMDWVAAGTALPDITDPFISAAFSADRFASDGSSSVFAAPKLFYRAATLADFNSAIPNGGTISSLPLTKLAGTYV